MQRRETVSAFLYSVRDDVLDIILPFGFCLSVILLVAFPQVEEQTKRHRPKLLLRQVKLGDAVIEKPGKQFLVCYPTCAFFGSASLSILRFVPL